MSYIGRSPTVGNFQICDAISTVNNQAAYTMQVGSVNVLPETALVTGDVINFIQILGDVLDLGVPSDGTVTSGKLGADSVNATKIADGSIENEHLNVLAITGQSALTSVASDDTVLISDTSASGALKKMTRANFVSGIGGVNTPYFHAYSLSGQTLNNATETKKTFTHVTESASGVFDLSNDKFTVATAGKYFLTFNLYGYDTGNHIRRLDIWMKKGGSQKVKFSWNFTNDVGGRDFSIGNSFIMDLSVNDYIEMYVYQSTGDSGSIELRGSSSEQSCYFSGFKLIE